MNFIDLSPKYERRLPKVGDILPIFDDGKIRPSRLAKGTVIEVIPFKEAFDKEFEMIDFEYDNVFGIIRYTVAPLSVAWKEAYTQTDWIFNETTDYFIIVEKEDDYEPIEVFARKKNGGWFSFPLKTYMTGAELDSDMALFNDWNGSEYYSEAYNDFRHDFKMIED